MRKSAPWQSVWDDRILEWIRENEGVGSAADMKKDEKIRTGRSNISQRMNKLAEADLLKPLGNGVYAITEAGEAYLDEEYDVEEGRFIGRDVANGESGPNGTETENGV